MDVSNVQTGFQKNRDDIGVRCQKLFRDFLEEFKQNDVLKYEEPCIELEKLERNSLEVNFYDLEQYNQNLAQTIVEEYYRVYPYLCRALAEVVKDLTNQKENKQFYVSFYDTPMKMHVRELKSAKVGTLVSFIGQVVRTHPVHPELILGTFHCLDCKTVIHNVEQQFKYTQPIICRNPVCSNRRRFKLDIDNSIFVDFQKIRIQELQEFLPKGCIPRSMDVVLRAEAVEMVQAGDKYEFTGTLIVVPDVGAISLPGAKAQPGSRHKGGESNVTDGVRGLKALGVRDLNYKLAFLACGVAIQNAKFGFSMGDLQGENITVEMIKDHMTDAEWERLYEMSKTSNLCNKFVETLFPSIYGNDEVKKGVLLMLFGGVGKKTMEGTALRGDINCCIVGDPSTAKSQILKQVAEFYPKSVYTSGKASSAAGLTAAVVRDEESSDFVIEAGALMLADNGLCCIDEFDKMDPRDQVAIHEAMEQQTISLAKAGVRGTLNARTSILAAANPIGGRYDRTKSLQQNVSLSAPIMSRFDLLFVLVDECNAIVDYAIADKILDLHRNVNKEVELPFTKEEVLRYILFAKHFKPCITPEASKLLVHFYEQLRQRDGQSSTKTTWRITVRQLESLIRLSEATAKMECTDQITPRHVQEAYHLLNKSIIRVEQPDVNLGNEEGDMDDVRMPDAITETGSNDTTAVAEDRRPRPAATKLSFEDYRRLTDAVVIFIKNEEERRTEEAGEGEIFEGVRKSEVINMYLEKALDESDMITEEELVEKKRLIMKVLDRLITFDQVLIPLSAARTRISDEDLEESEDPILVVHPNYVVDD